MNSNSLTKTIGASLTALVLNAGTASAVTSVQVSFESTGPVAFAPLFSAFSSPTSGYDVFNPGEAASAPLERLAENGGPPPLITAANGTTGAQGFALLGNMAPVFTVGGSNSAVFDVTDGYTNFNYAAMILPSNDWFIGNGAARDISDLIDGTVGSIVIDVSVIWDAGTEEEDFSTGPGAGLIGVMNSGNNDVDSGTPTVGGVITQINDTTPYSGFANANGFDIENFQVTGNIARITLTVVPEPSSALLLGLSGLALIGRRRR